MPSEGLSKAFLEEYKEKGIFKGFSESVFKK
jgi:hypothetical protein